MGVFGAHNLNQATKENTPVSLATKAVDRTSTARRRRAQRVQNVKEAARRRERTVPTPASVSIVVVGSAQSTPRATQEATQDDVSMMDIDETAVASSSKTKSLTLPRRLYRPQFREPSPATLAKVEKDFPEIPLGYLQEKLHNLTEPLMDGLSTLSCSPPRSKLTSTVNVHLSRYTPNPPTHMLAVHGGARSEGSSSNPKKITLLPAHNVVLALHCTNLGALPKSRPTLPTDTDSNEGFDLELPVVPLGIPHPQSFVQLQTYLYTKNASGLFSQLLPSNPPVVSLDSVDLDEIAPILSSTYTRQHLLSHLANVSGLWRNACVLGLGYGCESLYDAIEKAWEILLGALALSDRA